MSEMTLCFRFKPLVLNNTDSQGQTYVMSIADPGKLERVFLKSNLQSLVF